MLKDIITQLGGFLTALLAFFTVIGISFEWFTPQSIDAFLLLVSSFAGLAINIYAVYKNTHVKKRLEEKKKMKGDK